MKYLSRRATAFVVLFILIVSSLGASCSLNASTLPDFQNIPQTMELEQLWSDFSADTPAAEERHIGKVYLFPDIVVDRVVSLYTDPRAELSDLYVQNGNTRFRPAKITALDDIAPGFVVDIIGEVTGWVHGPFNIINNCSFAIVRGGDLPPAGSY